MPLFAIIAGVTREFPVYYGTHAEAQKTLDRLKTGIDPSFCHADDTLEVVQIGDYGVYIRRGILSEANCPLEARTLREMSKALADDMQHIKKGK